MNTRKAALHTELELMNVGPFRIKQPLPNKQLKQVSPFLLIHHGGPDQHAPGAIKARLSPHPHRGFEPVTFLFSGKMHHRDSTGSEGFLSSGGVQWMTAGSGIIHSEGPSAEFAKEGGTMELIQLWVNLPRDHKMTAPKYQDLPAALIPHVQQTGFDWSVVAGKFEDVTGPASTFSPILAMFAYFKAGGRATIPVPATDNALVYVLDGEIESGETLAAAKNLLVFENAGDTVELHAKADGKLLFLAGTPINEPIVSYGPFVMNYPGEIKQAILDYETGKMGALNS